MRKHKGMNKQKKGPGRPEKPKSEKRVTIRVSVLAKHETVARKVMNEIAKPYQS